MNIRPANIAAMRLMKKGEVLLFKGETIRVTSAACKLGMKVTTQVMLLINPKTCEVVKVVAAECVVPAPSSPGRGGKRKSNASNCD